MLTYDNYKNIDTAIFKTADQAVVMIVGEYRGPLKQVRWHSRLLVAFRGARWV